MNPQGLKLISVAIGLATAALLVVFIAFPAVQWAAPPAGDPRMFEEWRLARYLRYQVLAMLLIAAIHVLGQRRSIGEDERIRWSVFAALAAAAFVVIGVGLVLSTGEAHLLLFSLEACGYDLRNALATHDDNVTVAALYSFGFAGVLGFISFLWWMSAAATAAEYFGDMRLARNFRALRVIAPIVSVCVIALIALINGSPVDRLNRFVAQHMLATAGGLLLVAWYFILVRQLDWHCRQLAGPAWETS